MNTFTHILISGGTAPEFLQGQLTCDVLALDTHQGMPGAYCDTKGRMLANFWILRLEADSFLLWIHDSLATVTMETLKKYGIFSKVSVEIVPDWKSSVLKHLPAADDPNTVLTTPFPGDRHLVLHHKKDDATVPETSPHFWLDNIHANCALLTEPLSHQFTPQMIDWEKIGGVSFQKGCYLGQEVVARTQHLGKLKRHLYQASCSPSSIALKAGDKVTQTDGTEVGIITTAAMGETETHCLAVIQDRAIDSALQTHNTPLHIIK